MTKEEVLQNCTVDGNLVRLPAGQLERKLYMEVAKALELIGGKWKGGKTAAFVFQEDPSELLAEIATGGKRNLKKEHQFFATPADLADEMVDKAEIEDWHSVLEPSAGQGAIIEAIQRVWPGKEVFYCENMPTNKMILRKKFGNSSAVKDLSPLNDNFLELSTEMKYDRIVANPPFTKNQDIDHIRKMYEVLQTPGVMVTLASKHWQISQNKKETEFRSWLEKVGAEVTEIPAGTFKQSGTEIACVMITIFKRP